MVGLVLASLLGCAPAPAPAPEADGGPASPPRVTGRPLPTSPTGAVTAELVDGALERGATFLGSKLHLIDPSTLGVVDYLGRNWRLAALAAARSVALEAGRPEDPVGRQLYRLVDPGARLARRPPVGVGGDEHLMAQALHCDQVPLPGDYLDRVEQLSERDSYGLGHSLFALGWMKELGCGGRGRRALLVADITDRIVVELRRARTVTDPLLSLSAMVSYAGRSEDVPEAWIGRTLAAQLQDGSWRQDPRSRGHSWHTTLLAVWTLAAHRGLGQGVPMARAA